MNGLIITIVGLAMCCYTVAIPPQEKEPTARLVFQFFVFLIGALLLVEAVLVALQQGWK